jgi:hypothetical protein
MGKIRRLIEKKIMLVSLKEIETALDAFSY